jgi:histidine ammonia-lyase
LNGERMASAQALQRAGLRPLQLQAKEGLALLNGTQAMTAVGGLSLVRAQRIVALADVAGAMTLEALLGTPAAFDPRIHELRPHVGQSIVAARLRTLIEGSEIRESHRHGDPRVQDAYSLRCMPQVHGAVRDALAYSNNTLEIETGSATDNPLVLKKAGGGFDIVSGGNFHGAPVAAALDFAALALTDLISITERRVDRMVNPDLSEGLPPFLTREAGVGSGFMIAHVTVAALLNESRALAYPASVDNTPTSGGKEDHVSMGMTAALKLRRIAANAEYVTAIELMAAAQGLDYRLPLQPLPALQKAKAMVREIVPIVERDRVLATDIEALAAHIREGKLDELLS